MAPRAKEKRKGLLYSSLLHLFWLLLILVGLPSFFSSPPVEPQAITVEILPITGVTNIKPSAAAPAKAEEKKPPAPPVKTTQETPLPKPSDRPVVKAENKKPEPKKEKEKKKPKEKPDDLEAVLKAVRDTAQKQKETESTDKTKSVSNQFDPSKQLSMSEQDAIRNQIKRCWNVPAGARDAQNLVVVLHLELGADGSVLKVELGDESRSRYDSDDFFRAAADSAMRAVRQCSPLQSLPPEKYETWRNIQLNFDPKEMLQ